VLIRGFSKMIVKPRMLSCGRMRFSHLKYLDRTYDVLHSASFLTARLLRFCYLPKITAARSLKRNDLPGLGLRSS
jgi:hypothetical protein